MDNRIFVGSCNGYFRAFDRRTGDLIWIHDTREEGDPVEFHGDVALAGGLLVVGSDRRSPGGEGRIYAFDPDSGTVRWTQPAGHGIATDLTLLGDRLFAVTLDDELLALDVRSGVPAWRFASGASNESFRMTSTPAIVDGRVFFGGLDGVVYAFDAETGSPLWKRPLGASVTTSVLADGGSLYAGTEDRRLHRLTPSTGEILASLHIEDRPWGRLLAGGPCLLSLLGEDAAARPGIGCASLDLERLAWSYAPEGKLSSARPYLWRGFVVIGDESGKVLGVRLSDGSPGWSIQVEGVVRGIGIMGDVAYIGTVKGRLYARRIAEAPPRLPKVSERAASSLPARAR